MSYRDITTDASGYLAAAMLYASANTSYSPSDRDREAIQSLQACDTCDDSICPDHGDDIDHLVDVLNEHLGKMEPPNER